MPNSVNSPAVKQTFFDFVDRVQSELDKVVQQGSEQELFIASYLTGHFSLLHRDAQYNDDYSMQAVDDYMISSLNVAFANKELAEAEQQQVLDLWQQLFHQYA